jgi:hypothetical protein
VTDTTQSGQPPGDGSSEGSAAASEPDTAQQASTDEQAQSGDQPGSDAPQDQDPQQDDGKQQGGKKGLLAGVLGGVGVLIVVVLLAAFVWPGFATGLFGPGQPDDKASEASAALGSKDPAKIEEVSCKGPDGKSTKQIPPQALQMVQQAKQTGPVQLTLDTEAQAPMELTLSAQGQTQPLPINAVLGVTNNEWCLKGISQRQ